MSPGKMIKWTFWCIMGNYKVTESWNDSLWFLTFCIINENKWCMLKQITLKYDGNSLQWSGEMPTQKANNVNLWWFLCYKVNIVKIIGHMLTHKQLKMHGWIFSSVATDASVLKEKATIIHGADLISIALNQFQGKCVIDCEQLLKLLKD